MILGILSGAALMVALSIFVATLTRSTLGFGHALIGMPLLALVVDIRIAAPVMGLVSVVMSVFILWESRREVDVAAAWRLVVASIVGMPAGIWILNRVDEALIGSGLGLLLIAFSLFALTQPTLPRIERGLWIYLSGALAGLLGAAYNTNGPPVVLYGALRHWSPARFRATLQGFFLPASVAISLSHGLGGLWNREVGLLSLISLPGLLIAIPLGGWLNRRIPTARFTRLVYWVLVGLGIVLVWRAMGSL